MAPATIQPVSSPLHTYTRRLTRRAVLLPVKLTITLVAMLSSIAPLSLLSAGASTVPLAALDAVACHAPSTCVAVGGAGTVLVSSDSGFSWSAQSVPTSHYLFGIACLSQGSCVAVGDAGTVLVSREGDGQWRKVRSRTDEPLLAVTCPGSGHCYTVGDGGVVIATNDGGTHWQRVNSGVGVIDGIACGSPTRCVAVTGNSEVDLYTLNGITWLPSTVRITSILALLPMNGVSCSGLSCLSVGGHGLMARSSDGGSSWTFLYPAVSKDALYGVACPTPSACVLVGVDGTIMTTQDGGATWRHVPVVTDGTLLGVTCPTTNHCVAVGSGGTVVATSNVGGRWFVRNGTKTGKPRITVLVVGDSFAHTLALYAGRNSPDYGVTLIDGGLDGCDLARGAVLGNPGSALGVPQAGAGPCAPSGPGWTAAYTSDVAEDRPNLSLLVLGPWDLSTRFISGQWLSPGQPAYDSYYRAQVTTAVNILTADGGRVAITTVPYVHTLGPQRCVPLPATTKDCPTESERVNALNSVAYQVATDDPPARDSHRSQQEVVAGGPVYPDDRRRHSSGCRRGPSQRARRRMDWSLALRAHRRRQPLITLGIGF